MRRLVCLLLGIASLAAVADGQSMPARADQRPPASPETETPSSGSPSASQSSNASGSQVGGDGGTSLAVPVVIAAGAATLFLGGMWWARSRPLPISAPLSATARANGEAGGVEGSLEPDEADGGESVALTETAPPAKPSDAPVTAEPARAASGAAVAPMTADPGAPPRRDREAGDVRAVTEREAFARLADLERRGETAALPKKPRVLGQEGAEESARDATRQEVQRPRNRLDELHARAADLEQEVDRKEKRLAATEERTLRALERAEARLEDAQARAADAEARAARTEHLQKLATEETERSRRLRETQARIADAERRASEADARARDLVKRASGPAPPLD
jgi:hypothetical protein